MSPSNLKTLVALRHWLHAYPELSRHEVATANHLRGFLSAQAAPDEFVPLADAGFAAVYNGQAPGKTVLIRTELDALPIHEINQDIPYRSRVDGVGHKCGHDGHMTIVAGLACELARHRPQTGRAVLLFQPDEETGSGARQCCQHENYAAIAPDYAFALHNLPGHPTGQILCRAGTFAAAVKYVAIHFTGKEAHSAQPETGVAPALAMAEITLLARTVQQEFDAPDAFALIVPVYSQMGVQASGVSPGAGEIQFTLRTGRGETLGLMWRAFSEQVEAIAAKHGLGLRFETREEFIETRNDASAVQMITTAAAELGFEAIAPDQPFRWGEDFGEITQGCNGAMFGLGAGVDHPALHHPNYDFPDALIPPGIAMFKSLVAAALNKPC